MAAAIAFPAERALAWTTEGWLGSGCHEEMTHHALAGVRQPAQAQALTSAADARLARNVDYSQELYGEDVLSLAAIVGVRYDDYLGAAGLDFESQVFRAANDEQQPAHCLRRLGDDGEAGKRRALHDCREHILAMTDAALDSVAADGTVDFARRVDVDLYVAYAGTITYKLPAFHFYAGRALHTLQDAFSHAIRLGPQRHEVADVFNVVDVMHGDHQTDRDGLAHVDLMDVCHGEYFSFLDSTFADATQASADFVHALFLDAPAEKRRQAVVAVLDRWLHLESGCNQGDGFCGSRQYAELKRQPATWHATGCANDASDPPTTGALVLIGLVSFVGLERRGRGRRRRHRRGHRHRGPSGRRRGPRALIAGALLVTALSGGRADADPLVGLQLGTSAAVSFDSPGAAMDVAVGYWFRYVGLHLNMEWNPWYAPSGAHAGQSSLSAGVFNVYAQVAVRIPLSSRVAFRFGGGIGTATLLQEEALGPAGSTGLYLGLRLAGLDIRLGRRIVLTIDAADVALPAPWLPAGYPVINPQHRVGIGLRFCAAACGR